MSGARIVACFVAGCFTMAVVASVAQEPATGSAAATQPIAADSDVGVVLILEQTAAGSGPNLPPQRITMTVLGREARTDLGKEVTSFMRANGDMVTLMHAQRTYTVVKPSLVKEGMERYESMRKSDSDAPEQDTETPKPSFKPTGERKRIGEHEATAYDFTVMAGMGNTVATRYWFATDYSDAEEIAEKMSVFLVSSQYLGVKAADIPKGIVVRTETKTPQGGVFIMDTVSAKLQRVDKSIFEMPAGYKKLEMMQLPPPR